MEELGHHWSCWLSKPALYGVKDGKERPGIRVCILISLPSSSAENTINSLGPIKGKKLRLFGFDIDPCINGEKYTSHYVKVHEIATSASMDLLGGQNLERESSERDCLKETKYECQFCCKAYANLQALGGHQNAHRKERLKKRKMHLKLSIKLYLQSLKFPARRYK